MGNTYIKLGTILYTKDGRKIGNAIVRDVFYRSSSETVFYVLVTDFGNQVVFNFNEINESFYISKDIQDYIDWLSAKLRLFNK